MDIRQLKLFCKVVDRHSFSLAAEELHITQPAASQQIHSLERELSVTLLDRSRRTVTPTDAGQVLYRYARDILDLHERARAEIGDLGELAAGHVVIGASAGPGEHVLPGMLMRFKKSYPGISISLRVDDTRTVLERVLARELELGAVGAVTSSPDLLSAPLARDQVVLVCGGTHPWASRDEVSLDELVAEPHIVQQQGAGVRDVVEEHLAARGIRAGRLNVVMEMGLMESTKEAVIAGGCVAFVSSWAITHELEHGLLHVVPVHDLQIRRDFSIVWSKSRILSRAAEAVLAFLREQYAAAGRPG